MVDVPIKIGDVACLFDEVTTCAETLSSSSASNLHCSAVNASKNAHFQDHCCVHTKKMKNPRTRRRRVKRRSKRTSHEKARRRTKKSLRAQRSTDENSSTVHTVRDSDAPCISSSEDENSVPGELKFRRADKDYYHVDHMDSHYHEVSYLIPVPKGRKPKDPSLTPITVGVIGMIGIIASKKLLKVLLDPGSTKTLINVKVLPKEANLKILGREELFTP